MSSGNGLAQEIEICSEQLGFPWNDSDPFVCPPVCMRGQDGMDFAKPVSYAETPPGGSDLSIFTPEEQRFAQWDCRFMSQIPGMGPELPTDESTPWSWQWMPSGVLYKAYLASNREARLGIHLVHEDARPHNFWDPILGGKIPLLRFGNQSKVYPEGFQLDVEGAALARLTLDHEREMYSADYRFALPLTYRKNHWEWKIGYYHISSHMGDEQMLRFYHNTGILWRRNYVRDCILFGVGYRPDANWRFYFGGDYAFYTQDGAMPWQLELGAEYAPIILPGYHGAPFAAVHLKWSEENDWTTYVAFEVGWQWRTVYQHIFRTGLYLMHGPADQYQFYDLVEKQIGWGMWFDF
ncbi:MAG: DUF1207 domain-containing protein [Planctomycetia bacterium]|nr:DUF1207 domain-containing protein [Planctomycetia bacterium]